MANSIRTPRQGLTETSRRIAEAVDDELWQRFRVSLKGKSTTVKLRMLQRYFDDDQQRGGEAHMIDTFHEQHGWSSVCWICIRVDNYLKALARGGQLYGGVDIKQALVKNWALEIKKD